MSEKDYELNDYLEKLFDRIDDLQAENQRLKAFINTAQVVWYHGNEDELDTLLESGRISLIQTEVRPCGCVVEKGFFCWTCENDRGGKEG